MTTYEVAKILTNRVIQCQPERQRCDRKGEPSMKAVKQMIGGVLIVSPAFAEVTFVCKRHLAKRAPSRFGPSARNGSDTGAKTFVLDSGASHGLNDLWKGRRIALIRAQATTGTNATRLFGSMKNKGKNG